jgi:enoyl-CoA hydratase/carnithine racemase
MLAMCCDVRIAAEHATFGMPEVKWNLTAWFGARLEYLVSIGVACEMLMWGHTITAQRAYEVGFVNKVVPKEKLMDECMTWAEEVCSLGLPSVMAHKELIYRGRNMSVGELDALGRDLFYWWPPKSGVVTDPAEGAKKYFESKNTR